MSITQSGLEMSNLQAYRNKLFSFVGNRDPLEVLGQTASGIEEVVRKHPVDVLRARPFPAKWTPNEIVGHLTDSELVNGYRTRLIFSEENPTILGMNQELWVSRQRHKDREPAELAEMFRDLRRCNLMFWKQISGKDLQRAGQHNERGAESLGLMLRMLAGHDLSHLDQLHRYLSAVKSA